MATSTITIQIRVAWWVRWYLATCLVFASLHGLRPNGEKIVRTVVRHGIRTKVI